MFFWLGGFIKSRNSRKRGRLLRPVKNNVGLRDINLIYR